MHLAPCVCSLSTPTGGSALESDSRPEAAAELADAFGRAGKVLVRRFDERLGEHGVSTPRSKLLAEIARLGPARVTDLARVVGVSQGTASTLADALVRDGLVERTPDEADRRVTWLTVTTAGGQQATAWLADYRAAAEQLFAVYDPDELQVLIRLLNRLTDDPT